MANWGSCEFSELKKFKQDLEKLAKTDSKKFCEEATKELAARFLRKVISETPVHNYRNDCDEKVYKKNVNGHKKGEVIFDKNGKPKRETYKTVNFTTAKGKKVHFKASMKGRMGGTLLRGWTAKTEEEAKNGKGQGKDVNSYMNELPMVKVGDSLQINISNSVSYFPYVEYGHRTRNHKGYVPGRLMMTKSYIDIKSKAQGIVDKKLKEFLGDVFNENK